MIKEKRKLAVYETDVESDFCYRTGALFVHANKPWKVEPYGAEAKIQNIISIHKYASEKGWRIFGSVDRHFYEDVELIRNAGGIFVDHCMNGTEGQLRIAELEPQKDVYVRHKDGPLMEIRKYTEKEAREILDSGMNVIFEKQSYDVNSNPNFELVLGRAILDGLDGIIFDGFATDYCVKAAVLGVAKLRDQYKSNLKIYLVSDAIEEVNINFEGKIDSEFGKKALEEMVSAGAILVTTQDILEGRI